MTAADGHIPVWNLGSKALSAHELCTVLESRDSSSPNPFGKFTFLFCFVPQLNPLGLLGTSQEYSLSRIIPSKLPTLDRERRRIPQKDQLFTFAEVCHILGQNASFLDIN